MNHTFAVSGDGRSKTLQILCLTLNILLFKSIENNCWYIIPLLFEFKCNPKRSLPRIKSSTIERLWKQYAVLTINTTSGLIEIPVECPFFVILNDGIKQEISRIFDPLLQWWYALNRRIHSDLKFENQFRDFIYRELQNESKLTGHIERIQQLISSFQFLMNRLIKSISYPYVHPRFKYVDSNFNLVFNHLLESEHVFTTQAIDNTPTQQALKCMFSNYVHEKLHEQFPREIVHLIFEFLGSWMAIQTMDYVDLWGFHWGFEEYVNDIIRIPFPLSAHSLYPLPFNSVFVFNLPSVLLS